MAKRFISWSYWQARAEPYRFRGSVVKLTPYNITGNGLADDGNQSKQLLLTSHTYVIKDVWGPGGNMPQECRQSQTIKTNAAGVYGGNSATNEMIDAGGFSVIILGGNGALDPGLWGQYRRPTFMYEVIDKI